MGKDIWFNNSGDIVDYLSGRGHPRMLYRHIDMVKMAEKRISDEGETQATKGSNSYHLFVFKPNTLKPLTKTLLCDCEKCLMVTFEECEHVDRKVEKTMMQKMTMVMMVIMMTMTMLPMIMKI